MLELELLVMLMPVAPALFKVRFPDATGAWTIDKVPGELRPVMSIIRQAMVTTFAPFACVIGPAHVIVPPPPPVTLKVEPLAPVSVPPPADHVPVTPLRFTPLVPPLELTLWNWPVTAPLVRFSAVAPETW